MVQGVGYPNPNRSHSRSMEIWQTGEVGPVADAGWLGRAAEMHSSIGPCYVGSEATPLAVRGRKYCTPSIASLSDYRVPPGMTAPADRTPPVDDLALEIERRTQAAVAQARKLEAIAVNLPKAAAGSLEERLSTIRVLIEHDPGLLHFTRDPFGTVSTPMRPNSTHIASCCGRFRAPSPSSWPTCASMAWASAWWC